MAVRWAASATRHGVSRSDALHATLKARYVVAGFDESSTPGDARPILHIGPALSDGRLVEVIIEIIPPHDISVFHAMDARPKLFGWIDERAHR